MLRDIGHERSDLIRMSGNSKNSGGDEPSLPMRVGPRLPPLRTLTAFEAAARHGSFAKGAEELGVTPSAISHHVQQLEEFLGVSLFERRASRAHLTIAGRAYADEIKHAFQIITKATQRVAPQSQQDHLIVASGPSFAAKWLQPRLPTFLQAYPSARMRLSTLSERDDIDTGRFDIAITYGRPAHTTKNVEALLVERLRPLCSPALAVSVGLRSPRDLAKTTLIHSVNALTWSEYLRRIDLGDLRSSNEIWLDRSIMAIEAAVSGIGVVLESEILASSELRNGKLIAPFDGDQYSVETISYYLVRTRGSIRGSLTDNFDAWLRAEIAAAK